MHVLIEKDGQTTTLEVEDLEAAQALADAGQTVLVPNKDGGHRALAGHCGESAVEEPAAAAPAEPVPAPAKKATAKKTQAKPAAKKPARKTAKK